MFFTFLWSMMQVVLLVLGKTKVIEFYTEDEKIREAVDPAWKVLIFFVFFDCMQGVSNGNVQGLGLLK